MFHLHRRDRQGKAVLRKKRRREQLLAFIATVQACTGVLQACAGAHSMARQWVSFGHRVKLISPQCVRPFVARDTSDAVDAEAIYEAASRPSMRFVTLRALHRGREFLVRDRGKTLN